MYAGRAYGAMCTALFNGEAVGQMLYPLFESWAQALRSQDALHPARVVVPHVVQEFGHSSATYGYVSFGSAESSRPNFPNGICLG